MLVIVEMVVLTCVLVILPDVIVFVTGHEVTVVWRTSVVYISTVLLALAALK